MTFRIIYICVRLLHLTAAFDTVDIDHDLLMLMSSSPSFGCVE